MGPWGVFFVQLGFVILTLRLLIYFRDRVNFSVNRITLIVIGSGGHTKEMFSFLSTLQPVELKLNFTPRHYVIAQTDKDSLHKVEAFEQSLAPNLRSYHIHYVPRSREVGQSYISSVWTTLYSIIYSLMLVWKITPELILANGPGTCLPICLSAYLLRILGRCGTCCIALSESYACVTHASLTTRLLYPFVDVLFVQWPQLIKKFPKAVYAGRIPISVVASGQSLRPPPSEDERKSFVLVTVGSTQFNALISAIDNRALVQQLKTMGYSGLHVQYGTGTPPKFLEEGVEDGFEIQIYSKKSSLTQEIAECSLVIGHAGVGTIFDAIEAEKDMIAVANTSLMNNHQTEIALEMSNRGYVMRASPQTILPALQKLSLGIRFTRFPKKERDAWKSMVKRICGLGKKNTIF